MTNQLIVEQLYDRNEQKPFGFVYLFENPKVLKMEGIALVLAG